MHNNKGIKNKRKYILSLLIIVSGIFLLFFYLNKPKKNTSHIYKDYVYVHDKEFRINGEKWVPLMLNYKANMSKRGDSIAVVPADYYHGNSLAEHFDTIASWGFNSVRVCLDAISKYDDTASMFRATRKMVEAAADAGLRVMLLIEPPFEEYWKNYTLGLLKHLSDMPMLWAYDFMNEPLYFDPEPAREKRAAYEIADSWREMVRENTPQLFTIATAEPIEVFEWDPSIIPVDFIQMHTYNPLRVESEMWWYSHYCDKPWMIGETGLPADGDSIPYSYQCAFMRETYRYAMQHNAAGYGWWEFQDHPEGVNFEAQYTGLSKTDGTRKPAADIKNFLYTDIVEEDEKEPVGYYNMIAYHNVAVTGRVVDDKNRPIEGAVIRGWNKYWSVGMNTYTDADGRFRLLSNDINVHFEISAPGYSKLKFDKELDYPKDIHLPDVKREYQTVDYRPYLSKNDSLFMPDDANLFAAPDALEADMGTIQLKRLNFTY